MMNVVGEVAHRARSGVGRLRREVLARPFLRHVSVLKAANLVSAALSFVQGILVARWLGPELYGVAALVMTAPWAARSIVHRPELTWLIVLDALLPRAFGGAPYAVLATLRQFPLIATIETVTTALRVTLVLGLVLAGWQVAGVDR